MKHYIIMVLCMLSAVCHAQDNDFREDLNKWITAEDMESYGEETLEMLTEMATTKINLNQTSREELEQLPFLTAQQVEGLCEYLDRYSPMRSLSELLMIRALDWPTRKLLEHFVYVGPETPKSVWPKLSQVAEYGKHSLTATIKIPFYNRKGDILTNGKGYLGYKYRHDIRYQFTYNDRIKFGITGAQDAGEPFFSNNNKMGYDHYSYYFQLRKTGRLEAFNLGMYRMKIGMGLILNSGFNLGKLAYLQNLGRSSYAIIAHTSRSASDYFQGAAATIRLSNRFQVTAFASYRALDATLNNDGTVKTLLYDNYHRTVTELAKKNNTHETDLGLQVGWRKSTTYLHLNAVHTRFDRPLKPETTKLYLRYAPQGSHFTNVSLDYGYNNRKLAFSGETAINGDGALATIHVVNYRFSSPFSVMALHRYYSQRYTALHAQSFGENSSIQNEHGLYLGASWTPSRSWYLQGYIDYAHFSAPRYQVTSSSDAFDAMLSTRYLYHDWSFEGRYRFHLRQHDNSETKRLENRPEHRLRLSSKYTFNQHLSLLSQIDGINTRIKGRHQSGVMVSEQASWKSQWLTIDGSAAWFHTDDYESRLYRYESSILYDFSFPMHYGHGIRYMLMFSANIGNKLKASAKLGVTDFFDRAVISSDMQEIAHSSMADLLIQVSYKL